METISVIVPVYKVEKYLEKCIKSILEQTYTDLDLILVDDGSPDNCGEICDTYAEKDKRITVIHQENKGLSEARNAGLDWVFKIAEREWICFVDSDDWLHPKCLEELYKAIKENNVKISSCYHMITYGKNFPDDMEVKESRVLSSREFYLKGGIERATAHGKLYHKELFDGVRYPKGKIHEDEFVTYKILYSVEELAIVDNQFYAYYQRKDSIMNQQWSIKRLDILEALEEQYDFFQKKGYVEECEQVLKKYLSVLRTAIRKLGQDSLRCKETRAIKRHIKKKMRKFIKDYYKNLNIDIYDYIEIFIESFAGGIKIVAMIKWIKNKIMGDCIKAV